MLIENIRRFLAGEPLDASYDGHANCFIETGLPQGPADRLQLRHRAAARAASRPPLGPMPLLKESRLNHLGKLMFQWIYWHVLLPGRDIPGIAPQMPMAGKKRPLEPDRLSTKGAPDDDTADPRRHRRSTSTPKASSPTRRSGTRRSRPRSPRESGHRRADTDATGRSSTSCATTTSRPAPAPSIRTLGKASGVADQGALPALPQGPGQARRQDRRHPQAPRLHLGGDDDDHDRPRPRAARRPEPRETSRSRSRRSRSSSPRARSRASTPA